MINLFNKFATVFRMDWNMLEKVSTETSAENQRIIHILSFIGAAAFGIMSILSSLATYIKGNRPIYIIFCIFCIISFYVSGKEESPVGIRIHLDIFVFAILLFGVLLGAVFSPNELSVTYVVLMFAIPLVVISNPIILNSILLISILIYFIISSHTQTYAMLIYNMINVLIFGVLSMLVSSFMVNVRIQRIYYQKKNSMLELEEKRAVENAANHDQLTGCKNRNALKWAYKEDFAHGRSVAVIMCDLNGLKQINDLQGHIAGDAFISKTSEILRNTFSDDNVYRIGGDEFLIILFDEELKDFSSKLKALRITLGSTCSIGIERRDNCDVTFDELMRNADSRMYVEKQKYYAAHPEKKDGRQAVMEYQDIISSAGLGIWHIILSDNAQPRMQANWKMAELLGIDSSGMTEEEIYSSWYDRITPEALPSVKKSVQEMIDGNFSENTYLWNHPTKGNIYVRCGGTAVTLPDGTNVLRGYHGDVTSIVLGNQQRKVPSKSEQQ